MTQPKDDPRQRSAETKRVRTRSAVLEATVRLVRVRNWQHLRMEDVAKEAGVSVATLYNHYRTKQDLAVGVFLRMLDPESIAPARPRGERSLLIGYLSQIASIVHQSPELTLDYLAAQIRTDVQSLVPPLWLDAEDEVPVQRVLDYHFGALMTWAMTHPDEPPQTAVTLVYEQIAASVRDLGRWRSITEQEFPAEP